MTVDCDGKLSPREKIRTKKRAISEMAKTMMAHVQDGADYSGKCIMSHSACRRGCRGQLRRWLRNRFLQLKGKIEVNDIGTLIGSHTGPGTVALFFMGRQARGLICPITSLHDCSNDNGPPHVCGAGLAVTISVSFRGRRSRAVTA